MIRRSGDACEHIAAGALGQLKGGVAFQSLDLAPFSRSEEQESWLVADESQRLR